MKSILLALMVWISQHSDLPIPDTYPTVHFESFEQLHARGKPNLPYDPTSQPHILGLYKDNKIYLHDRWRPDRVRDLSMLVHELVHHMQWHYNWNAYECSQKREELAYWMQFAFMKRQGIEEPMTSMGLNRLSLYVLTTCPPSSP